MLWYYEVLPCMAAEHGILFMLILHLLLIIARAGSCILSFFFLQTCGNPDCLYLHDVGSQEDSFTKDEIISAYTRYCWAILITSIVQDLLPSSFSALSLCASHRSFPFLLDYLHLKQWFCVIAFVYLYFLSVVVMLTTYFLVPQEQDHTMYSLLVCHVNWFRKRNMGMSAFPFSLRISILVHLLCDSLSLCVKAALLSCYC